MNRQISTGILTFSLAGIAVGAAVFFLPVAYRGAFWDGPVLRVAATMLSMLTGFLMATIVMLGDPKSLYGGGWKVASAHKRQIRRATMRLVALFYAYLVAVILVFLALLTATLATDPERWLWVGRAALGSSTAALFWSLCVPWIIYKTQMDRLESVVKERKEEENVDTSEGADADEGLDAGHSAAPA